MSELEVKRSQALKSISMALDSSKEDKVVSVHEFNVLALGLVDTFTENNATLTCMTLTQGRGKPKVRQRYYCLKVKDLRVAMGNLLDDITKPEDKIVEQEVPAYLRDLTEESYPAETEDKE